VLQCVAVCGSVLKYVSVHCSMLQCVAVCRSVLQRVAQKRCLHSQIMRRDSFIREMTHIQVTSLIHMCDITPSQVT